MGVPMVTRTVLVPIDLYAEIVNYADSHEISWAAAVRTLTERGFMSEAKKTNLLVIVSIIAVTFFVFSAGFWIGTGWSTGGGGRVYSTDSAQCPTDATFCQQVTLGNVRTRGLLPQTLIRKGQAS